jgi:anaerobic selenocysteine-containing dehydrogenase
LTTGVFSPANHNDVYKAILTGKPYPVKAFLSIGGGCVLTSNEDTKNVYEALMKVDFLVQADLLPSPMTEIADIVLPVASWVERDNIRAWWVPLVSQNETMRTEGVKTDLEILAELSRRLDANWPWKTTEELFDYCLEPLKMNYREFQDKGPMYPPYEYYKYKKGLERPDGKAGFGTASGKVELFSSFVEDLPGIDPLPLHVEPAESPLSSPELLKEYPYVLTTGGRIPGFFHSEGRQIPWMRELHPDPLVELHPKTARENGIQDGEWVYVETKRGRAKMKAKLFTGIDPRVIRAEHNWWYPERLGRDPYLYGALEPTINRVTDPQHCDPSMGSSTLRGMLCRISKAEG